MQPRTRAHVAMMPSSESLSAADCTSSTDMRRFSSPSVEPLSEVASVLVSSSFFFEAAAVPFLGGRRVLSPILAWLLVLGGWWRAGLWMGRFGWSVRGWI